MPNSTEIEREHVFGSIHTNLEKISDFLRPFNLTLPEYLDLSNGAPTNPLALPPKYMDADQYLAEADELEARAQAARNANSGIPSDLMKRRWHHFLHVRPINAARFRAQLGALLEERCELFMKCKRDAATKEMDA